MAKIAIAGRSIGDEEPTYFIADMAANHDGDLERARYLVELAKEAGADAVKLQNFRAAQIVSAYGFETMGVKSSHQARWRKSVFQVYEEASTPWEWTEVLARHCEKVRIHYLSTPYEFGAVDMLEPYVPGYKIGSGDITWLEMIEHIARKQKPVLLATGASAIGDVQRAVQLILSLNPSLVVMQCNTNYTGSSENFNHLQLRVLRTFREMWPDVVLGLSDHTPGHAAVLGAVALGARVVEKHFTDDTEREGPDHGFSMDPRSWREMVDRTRELEHALGDGDKRVMANEQETVIVQRRCLRAARDIPAGFILAREDIDVLRPAPRDGIAPHDIDRVLGARTRRVLVAGEHLRWDALE